MLYKFIFARYNENISWIYDHDFIANHAIIYNKGEKLSKPNKYTKIYDISNNPPFARESGTYLTYIIDNFSILPEYMIFSQAQPFEHQSYFIDLTKFGLQNKVFKDFQPLSYTWKQDHGIPPINNILYDKSEYIDQYPIYLETLSNALETISYQDTGMIRILSEFMRYHKLSDKKHILYCLYQKLNIQAPYANFIKFNYGGIFGVHRDNILQHSKEYYINIYNFVNEHWTHGFMLERLWYTLLNKY